jgi:hypothetical protein
MRGLGIAAFTDFSSSSAKATLVRCFTPAAVGPRTELECVGLMSRARDEGLRLLEPTLALDGPEATAAAFPAPAASFLAAPLCPVEGTAAAPFESSEASLPGAPEAGETEDR